MMNMKTFIILFAQLCIPVISLPAVSLRGDIEPGPETARPRLVRQPEDVTAVAGETVRLSCLVPNLEGARCQWTKDGFGLGEELSLPGYERYRMEESQDGLCSLVISPVLVKDQAQYQCQLGSLRSRDVSLVVNSPPSLPYITQAKLADILEVEEGEEVELQCETSGARPPADIQWRDSQGHLILSNMLETVKKNTETDTFRTVSSIKLKPEKDLELSCAAYSEIFPAMKESRQLSVKINYKPRLSLNVTEQYRVSAGDDLTITCSSLANTNSLTYKWFINNQEVLGRENTDTITIANISEDLDRAEVKCEAENSVGVSQVSTRLSVVFQPRITEHPESVVAKPGSLVSFHCGALANPAASFVWVRGAEERIAGVSDTLTLTAGPDTEDKYKCKVFYDGQELHSRPAYLRLLRPPTVLTVQQKTASVGDDVILHCQVFSLDNNTKINWTRNNDPVRLDGTKYRALPLVSDERTSTFTSDLVIFNIQPSDFGSYGCFAQNEIGTDHKLFLLAEEQKSDWIAIIISINTIIAVTILAAVILWGKRKTISKWIREGNRRDRELPVVQRDVLPPIYSGKDDSIFEELLLGSGMGEKEYLKLSKEYHDRPPND